MNYARERLDEGCLRIADIRRDLIAGASRHSHILREASRARDAHALPVETMIGLLLPAEIAFAAVQVRIDRHSFAACEPRGIPANIDDAADELMAGDERECAVVLIVIDVQVGS